MSWYILDLKIEECKRKKTKVTIRLQTVKILKNIIKFLQRVQTMKTNLDHPPAGEPVSADEGEVRPRRQVVPRECHQKYDVPGNYFKVSSMTKYKVGANKAFLMQKC